MLGNVMLSHAMSHWAVQCCTISYNAMLMLCCPCNFLICSAMFFTFMLLRCCSVTGCAHCAAYVRHCSYKRYLVTWQCCAIQFYPQLCHTNHALLCDCGTVPCSAKPQPSNACPALLVPPPIFLPSATARVHANVINRAQVNL